MRQALNFYDFFKRRGFTEKEIDILISRQTPEMIAFLQKRFGPDLKSIIENGWTKREYNHYYSNIIKRFIKELEDNYLKKLNNKTKGSENMYIDPTLKEEDVKVYTKQEEKVKVYPSENEEMTEQITAIKSKLIEYMNAIPYVDLLKLVGELGAIIISLKYGRVTSKMYSTEEIAQMLGIPEEGVDHVINMFRTYVKKQLINEFEKTNDKTIK